MLTEGNTLQVNAVQAAIEQAGGVDSCARLLKVSKRLIYYWMKRGHLRGVAAERVLALEEKSGIDAEHLVGLRRRNSCAANPRRARSASDG